MITLDAPAKINLALHVTGQRADGYHLLESIVCFCDVGDQLKVVKNNVTPPANLFQSNGPFGDDLGIDTENLVMKAYELAMQSQGFAAHQWSGLNCMLTKNLPIASGMGGGSADAAAMLNALKHFAYITPDDALALAKEIGADVPMCLTNAPKSVSGIGEITHDIENFAQLHLVLVNPGVAVSTPKIFSALTTKENPPIENPLQMDFSNPRSLASHLSSLRNDLEAPAIKLTPEISTVMETLRKLPDCLLARMSGSGATCFGLFESAENARYAAQQITDEFPDWWVRPTMTYGSRDTDAAI